MIYEGLNPDTLVQLALAAALDLMLGSLQTGLELHIHLVQLVLVAGAEHNQVMLYSVSQLPYGPMAPGPPEQDQDSPAGDWPRHLA